MTKAEMNEAWRLIGTYRNGDPRLADQRLLSAWYRALALYRLDDVQIAITAHFKKSNFFPDVSEIIRELPPIPEADKRRHTLPTPSEQRSMAELRAWQDQWHRELREMGLPTLYEAVAAGKTPGEWAGELIAAGAFGGGQAYG